MAFALLGLVLGPARVGRRIASCGSAWVDWSEWPEVQVAVEIDAPCTATAVHPRADPIVTALECDDEESRALGRVPVDVEPSAGRHRVRLSNPQLGERTLEVEVPAGGVHEISRW